MNMAVDFAAKVFAFTEENTLFSAPCHVLVGASGGADSMALLHIMTHWPTPGIRVSAVHIHHGLRGETADRDETFVRCYCEENGIDLTVYREDVSGYAASKGLTLEEAGRQIRYADFEKCCQAVGADYVLTAHTASDQAETVLMRIIRGTGVDGLVGISPAYDTIRRPLLGCSRAEVEAYCQEHRIPFVNDETNTDVTFTRNRIRHEILPLLRQLNPAVDEAILRLSNHATVDAAYFRERIKDVLAGGNPCSVSDLNALAKPVRSRIIGQLFCNAGITSYDQCHIQAVETLIAKGYGSVCLPGGTSAVITANQLLFVPSHGQPVELTPISVEEFPFTFSVNGCDYTIAVTDTSPDENVHNLFSTSAVDYDRIQGKLLVRSRREGDTIHPAGRGIGKSVKKLMNECQVPVVQRDVMPLVCDEQGVVWIPGMTCDERVRITEDTKHFLVWQEQSVQG